MSPLPLTLLLLLLLLLLLPLIQVVWFSELSKAALLVVLVVLRGWYGVLSCTTPSILLVYARTLYVFYLEMLQYLKVGFDGRNP